MKPAAVCPSHTTALNIAALDEWVAAKTIGRYSVDVAATFVASYRSRDPQLMFVIARAPTKSALSELQGPFTPAK